MTTVEPSKKNCSLCGQPVEIEGFTSISELGEYQFCCAGCQSIYQLLYTHEGRSNTKFNYNEDNNK